MAIVALLGALDSLVESLVPSARKMRVAIEVNNRMEQLQKDQPELIGKVNEDALKSVREALVRTIVERLAGVGRARGGGAERWEEVLRHAGLHAPDDRPIPADLDLTLSEAVELSNVLVHRGARVDEPTKERTPTIPFGIGELVRIDRNLYRHYSAAIGTSVMRLPGACCAGLGRCLSI